MSTAETPSKENTGIQKMRAFRYSARLQTKIVRFTLDLDAEQHRFLRLFAFDNRVKASTVMRTLLYLLETDINIATHVIDEITTGNEEDLADGAARFSADILGKVIRFTLDLEEEQHRFLKLFAFDNEIKASPAMRTLLYLLETDINIATRVIDEIFADQNTEPTE